MRMNASEHRENAQEWIGASQGLTADEQVNRGELREQLEHTIADDEDVEEIACEIERICRERFA